MPKPGSFRHLALAEKIIQFYLIFRNNKIFMILVVLDQFYDTFSLNHVITSEKK